MSFYNNSENTNSELKNGVVIEQRRGGRESLVQWSNGDCRWVDTHKLHKRKAKQNDGEQESKNT